MLKIKDELCVKEHIPLNQALYIVSLYKGTAMDQSTLEKLIQSKMVEVGAISNKVYLTVKGRMFAQRIIGEVSKIDEQRYLDLAEKLREIYPAGTKPGTNYMWRDSKVIIAKKLISLVKKYGEVFTDEEAIDATKRYIESFKGDYKLMQLLKYFISKQRVSPTGEMEETSQLLSFIENKEVNIIDEDWTSNLR